MHDVRRDMRTTNVEQSDCCRRLLHASASRRATAGGGESGQAIVEFALVLIPLLVLVFGIIEFGIAFNRYITLTDAVRNAARAAAVAPSGNCNATATDVVTHELTGATASCDTEAGAGTRFTVTGKYDVTINIGGLIVAHVPLSSSSTERKEG